MTDNTTAWTPGPWVSTGFDYEPEAGWFIREDTGGRQRKAVARIADSFRSREEIEANAHLIAAAPDMAKALEETRRLVAKCCESGFGDEDALRALFANNGAITKALAKAKGQGS